VGPQTVRRLAAAAYSVAAPELLELAGMIYVARMAGYMGVSPRLSDYCRATIRLAVDRLILPIWKADLPKLLWTVTASEGSAMELWLREFMRFSFCSLTIV